MRSLYWALQVALDSRQCADAVLPEALCRHETVLDGADSIHHGQLRLVHRHAAVGSSLLCHDWLDCVPGTSYTNFNSRL